ncbi:DUF6412 domain-containing protein [Paractinoplanes maris]|uniref:DUF6412 domain-containing protein n=1 Tax=Paractinoplanes maris TaxID=1734446 RepID=UPI002020FA50|nr:DUF6412 domain-containing protein [Actinoplanes maris]
MTWLDAIWFLVSMLTEAGPSGLTGLVLIAVLAAGLMLVVRRGPARAESAGRGFKQRADRAGVPRHRDPDAPGRTRPRGPTARPVAAA